MRLKRATLFILLFTTTAIGQEEPLPVVTARAIPEPEVMLVALPVEPIRELHTPTLAEAARANDYISFNALYREAKERGMSVAAFDTLHELWTYSVTDPVGAFYGAEMYERLSRAYPGFAEFIDEHRIVDSNGNVFYPTSETREFVLARALEGRTAPRVLIAATDEAAPAPVVQPKRVAEAKRSPAKASAPKAVSPQPIAVAEAPVVIKAEPTPIVAEPLPAVVAEATPVVEAEPIHAVLQPTVAEPERVAAAVTPAPAQTQNPASRGLLLIVVGIMGAGLLAVMLRTPGETVPPVVVTRAEPPAAEETPAAPVEPLRRPERANRASGSRG